MIIFITNWSYSVVVVSQKEKCVGPTGKGKWGCTSGGKDFDLMSRGERGYEGGCGQKTL